MSIVLGEDRLAGILHPTTAGARVGVVVVVGGPQYRVGSHRQFVLLARALAAQAYPVLRFDYRGMGDSTGEQRDFQDIGDDIRAAIDCLVTHTGVARVVLWGLCDAASAAMMYAASDRRVSGLVLLNPWVHSPEIESTVRVKHYYLQRLRSPDFWRRCLRLQIDWRHSVTGFFEHFFAMVGRRGAGTDDGGMHFIERMRCGWQAFGGETLLILSGDDITAREFDQVCTKAAVWRNLRAARAGETVRLDAANHTFARADWRREVERATVEWLGRHVAEGKGDAERV